MKHQHLGETFQHLGGTLEANPLRARREDKDRHDYANDGAESDFNDAVHRRGNRRGVAWGCKQHNGGRHRSDPEARAYRREQGDRRHSEQKEQNLRHAPKFSRQGGGSAKDRTGQRPDESVEARGKRPADASLDDDQRCYNGPIALRHRERLADHER